MLTDPWFYAAALPAVIIYGLSKGGFSGVGLLSMPLLALVMSPVQAAAVMLPVLIAQDIVTVYAFRRDWDGRTLAMLLPGAVAGIGLGWLTTTLVTPDEIRLAVGLLAVAFCLQAWLGGRSAVGAAPHAWPQAGLLGALAGYASFVIHAGGPPYNMYALPRSATRDAFVATSAVFFAVVDLPLISHPALGRVFWFDTLPSRH